MWCILSYHQLLKTFLYFSQQEDVFSPVGGGVEKCGEYLFLRLSNDGLLYYSPHRNTYKRIFNEDFIEILWQEKIVETNNVGTKYCTNIIIICVLDTYGYKSNYRYQSI